jgi:hypothetical protein
MNFRIEKTQAFRLQMSERTQGLQAFIIDDDLMQLRRIDLMNGREKVVFDKPTLVLVGSAEARKDADKILQNAATLKQLLEKKAKLIEDHSKGCVHALFTQENITV